MRAWPLNQPHAGLVIDGIKAVETRPKPCRTLVGQRVVIHANQTHDWDHLLSTWPFKMYLPPTTYGALLGTVDVIDCVQMTASYVTMMKQHREEYALGDYAVGRWAFALTNPRPFTLGPLPWRGSQGVFMVPDEVIRARYECTCDVGEGGAYEDVVTDSKCWFHGDGGDMVVKVPGWAQHRPVLPGAYD